MRRYWVGFLLLLMGYGFPQQSDTAFSVSFKVVDADQKPVPDAWVSVYQQLQRRIYIRVAPEQWQTTNTEGFLSFQASKSYQEYHSSFGIETLGRPDKQMERWVVIVCAPGFLPYKEVLETPKFGTTYTIVLKRGKPFEIVLQNETDKPLPETLAPAVFQAIESDEDYPFHYLVNANDPMDSETPITGGVQSIVGQFMAERIEPRRYRISLPEDYNKPLFVMIHHKGFLRGFSANIPAEEVKAGRAVITLPKPFRAQLRVDTTQATETIPPIKYSLSTTIETDSDRAFEFNLEEEIVPHGQVRTFEWNDLYGKISAEISTVWDLRPSGTQEELFSKRACLAPDKEIVLAYTPLNPDAFKGELTHAIQVLRADNTPASGLPYQLVAYDSGRHVTVAEGVLDSKGRTQLNQLRNDIYYYLKVDNEEVGGFSLESPKSARATFRIPPRVGEKALDLTLTDLRTQKKFRLADLAGKWVCLYFWATWCGPCTETIRKIGAEGDRIEKAFGGKVALITISLDDSTEPIRPYLERYQAWDKARHCWSGAGGWYSPAGIRFGIISIPQLVMIDPSGKIAWRGHPTYTSLQSQIAEIIDLYSNR